MFVSATRFGACIPVKGPLAAINRLARRIDTDTYGRDKTLPPVTDVVILDDSFMRTEDHTWPHTAILFTTPDDTQRWAAEIALRNSKKRLGSDRVQSIARLQPEELAGGNNVLATKRPRPLTFPQRLQSSQEAVRTYQREDPSRSSTLRQAEDQWWQLTQDYPPVPALELETALTEGRLDPQTGQYQPRKRPGLMRCLQKNPPAITFPSGLQIS